MTTTQPMKDLKEKTIRGGLSRLCAQAATFLIRLMSLVILARLLGPKDFGLVGMVTAFTGALGMFRDFGLSSAAVQRKVVTEAQISTLFWINLLLGTVLGMATLALAPAIAAFYHEPRLLGVSAILALSFVFNAAGIQHSAMLQREMRFTAMAMISTLSLLVSTIVAIGGAKAGYGYWSLVAMSVTLPLTSTIGFWIATGWVPGPPRRRAGVRSMVRFGGTMTLNGLVAYLAYNSEKVLLGRFWGLEAIGIYGRAYQVISIPTDSLNSAVGEVAFAALSRVTDTPDRLRRYFLKGYSLVLTLTVPVTVVCAFFSNDVILVFLGSNWKSAAPVFRLLAPTILVFAIINPLGWLLYSLGLVDRSLKIAFAFAPLIISGYLLGLRYGPRGVAFAYSTVMVLWVIPHIALCVRGTVVSVWDILRTAARPTSIGLLAGTVAFGVQSLFGSFLSPLPRLIAESSVVLISFLGLLLAGAGEKSFYLELLRGLRNHPSVENKNFLSA